MRVNTTDGYIFLIIQISIPDRKETLMLLRWRTMEVKNLSALKRCSIGIITQLYIIYNTSAKYESPCLLVNIDKCSGPFCIHISKELVLDGMSSVQFNMVLKFGL